MRLAFRLCLKSTVLKLYSLFIYLFIAAYGMDIQLSKLVCFNQSILIL